MTRTQTLAALLALALVGAAQASDAPATSVSTTSSVATPTGSAPDPATTTVLDPVELTAEQRVERSLRTVQIALERNRSDRYEDQDKVVCVKEEVTGSHRQVINCATNRFWRAMRESSVGGLTGIGGGTGRKDEQMFTMKVEDYYRLEKRFGKLPEEMKDLR